MWNDSVDEAILGINGDLKTMCDNVRAFYFDAYAILSSDGKKVDTEFQFDFLHINEKGYDILSHGLIKQFNQIMTN